VRVIQAFARERAEAADVETLGERLFEEQLTAVKLRNRVFPIIRLVANLGNVLMLGGGAYFILRGEFTLGGLLAYRGYGRYFFGPIDDLVNANDLVRRAEAAGRRLFEVLDAPETVADAPGAPPLPPLRGEVRLENVDYGYDPSRPVLRGVSLLVRPGERVAIVGPSGAGKSTLLGLVARLHDPDAGRVLLDGHDLRTVTLASLRAQLGQVGQESYLFNATVLENLRFGRPEATAAEVEAAARAANAHDFVRDLPEGYDTVVGERGVKLSGGQRQRLSIARALLAEPRLLLLDEPTSAVEPEAEARIVEALERLARGRTTLVVSHRLSLARSADGWSCSRAAGSSRRGRRGSSSPGRGALRSHGEGGPHAPPGLSPVPRFTRCVAWFRVQHARATKPGSLVRVVGLHCASVNGWAAGSGRSFGEST
jgi:ABC-type multidrug transport system fused ATPase/permease subunit